MIENPLVTVICLCYNHESYLIESLNSVLNQSYPNIEIIIADDYSSDNSVSLIKNWIGNKNIPFIQNKTNIGNTKTFNSAFKFSKGDFIIDLALDDVLYPTSIEDRVNKFNTTKYKNLGVVFSNIELIDEAGNHISYLYELNEKNEAIKKPKTGNIYKDLVHSYFLNATSMLIKTEVLKKLDGYNEDLSYEDVDFWFRSSRIYDYDYVDKVLIKKRQVKNSLSSNFKRKSGKHLANTSYKNCKMAFKLNQNKEEHKALINRVVYELKLAFNNKHYKLAFYHFFLFLRIKIEIFFI